MPALCGVRRIAEDEHRQDPEVQAARARQGGVSRPRGAGPQPQTRCSLPADDLAFVAEDYAPARRRRASMAALTSFRNRLFAAAALSTAVAAPASAADYFAGKSIDLLIG